jgi:hypothetical protein
MSDNILGGAIEGGGGGGTNAGGGGFGSLSGANLLGLGTLGVGAGALGYMLSQGPAPLPSEFSTVTGTNVPALEQQAGALNAEGQQYINAGETTPSNAAAGILTPEQQATLSLTSSGLANKTDQTLASEGVDPNKSTNAISFAALNDAQVSAMGQQFIQSSIALGLGQVQAGTTMTGQASADLSAADQALISAGQAQIQQDTNYSNSLTSVFSTIGSMFGKILPGLVSLSDERVKTDIRPIGAMPNGIEFYSFRFKWDWTPYVGVIAQQVREIMPEAVTEGDDGLLRVDYGKVNARFMTLMDWRRFNG